MEAKNLEKSDPRRIAGAPADSGDAWLTLSAAAKLAPGRPSTNCMWRWCRRGVLARTGERLHLQHIRAGGRVMIRQEWIEEFCTKLAHADAAHFAAKEAAAASLPPRDNRFAPPSRQRQKATQPAWRAKHEDAELQAELNDEGL